jgi:hypothetical protein
MISRGTFLDAFRVVLRLNIRRSVRKICGLSRSKIFRRLRRGILAEHGSEAVKYVEIASRKLPADVVV